MLKTLLKLYLIKKIMRLLQINKKSKIVRYWVNFLTIKNQEFAANQENSLCSNTPAFAWLILFDFLSKISIRNSLIFLLWDWNFNFATAPLVICQIVLIKKFKLWPDRIKRIFENKKLKKSLFLLKLNHIIVLIILKN